MACIITYKGEEIPYEDWVQRLENGLLDELINDKIIDISEFKGEIKPTPIEKKEEVKQEELAPQKPKQPTAEKTPIRFEIGKKLNEKEKKEVLKSLEDSYKVKKRPYTIQDINDRERKVYVENMYDYMFVSDITGKKIRWAITLPDGKIAHPTEVYGNVSMSDVEKFANNIERADNINELNYESGLKNIKDTQKVIEILRENIADGFIKIRTLRNDYGEIVDVRIVPQSDNNIYSNTLLDYINNITDEKTIGDKIPMGFDVERFISENDNIDKKVNNIELSPKSTIKQPTTQAEVKAKLIELGLTEEEAETSSRIYDVYVKNKAAKTGRSVEDVYGDIEFKGEDGQVGLMQMPNGEIVKAKSINADVVNGFYSPLEKVINETKFDKLPAKQWIDKFAKGEEAKWTGLNEWLSQQQGSVSKSDIQKYLKDNRIEVVEVVKGDSADSYTMEDYEKFPQEVKDIADEVGEDGMEFYTRLKEIGYDVDLDIDGSVLSFNKKGEENKFDKATKFSQYQLEGEKENYKEVLVTMPPKKREGIKYEVRELNGGFSVWNNVSNQFEPLVGVVSKEEAQKRVNKANEIGQDSNYDRKDVFQSSHFEEPNILVHLRMNTRTDANGNKVLFLEEVQGDFPQEYRKQQNLIDDYVDKNSAKVIEAFKKKGILEVICP
jgi:hypothetical protein